MKILVLENVDSLDLEISQYLKKEHEGKDEIKVIKGILDNTKQKEVAEGLSWCDCLLMQSTFYNVEQLGMFLNLLQNFKNIKEIRIIFAYTNRSNTKAFLRYIEKSVYKKAIVALMNIIPIKEVICELLEKPTDKEYFKDFELNYDIVPLYFNTKYDMVWHEFKPNLDKHVDFMYKSAVVKEKVIAVTGKTFTIEKKDLETFNEIMNEARAMIEDQKESCELHDFGDSKTLIKEKNKWLKLLDKYKF